MSLAGRTFSPCVDSKSKLPIFVQALVNRDLRTLAWFISFQQK
jgi:hypothetical protein